MLTFCKSEAIESVTQFLNLTPAEQEMHLLYSHLQLSNDNRSKNALVRRAFTSTTVGKENDKVADKGTNLTSRRNEDN